MGSIINMDIIIEQTEKAEVLTSIFQHIRLFTDTVNLHFETERLYIQCMDHSHVSIMELILPSAWFSSYEVSQSIVLGVNAVFLYRVLNSRDKTQKIHFTCGESPDFLNVHLTGENKKEFDKHFELPLIDVDSELMQIPDVDYVAEIDIGSQQFAAIINQLKMFGDSLELTCTEEKIQLASSSQDQGKMFVEISIDDVSGYAINEGEELNVGFSLNYLHNMCMYSKIAKEVHLEFSQNYPMKFSYFLGEEEEKEKACLRFYLAPRVDED